MLVGGFNPSEKYEVNGKDYPRYSYIYILWKIKAMFQTTNQYGFILFNRLKKAMVDISRPPDLRISAWLVAPHEDVPVQVAAQGALRREHGLRRDDGSGVELWKIPFDIRMITGLQGQYVIIHDIGFKIRMIIYDIQCVC